MIEIHPRLHIGTEADYESHVRAQAGWWVVHACKEPYHRQLLGYTGRAAPKTHPEYLFARREKRMYLNIVDVEDPAYVAKAIIDATLGFLDEAMRSGDPVLVHCNGQLSFGVGKIRAPRTTHNGLVFASGSEPQSALNER